MHHLPRISKRAFLALSACYLLSHSAWAQSDWPQKPIKMIVPFAPGGSNDNIARLIGQKIADSVKQPVIVENRGGNGGLIGTDSVAQSPADGYTILFASSSLVTNALSGKTIKNDPLQAFTPIGKVGSAPLIVVASEKAPFKDVKELVTHAKSHPKTLNYGTAGVGGTNHLATELFAHAAKIELVHVPYKGIGQSYNDLMGGSLQMMVPSVIAIAPHIKSGKVRGLAVTSKNRTHLLPDIPTLEESGYPNFDLDVWFALLGPAGLPDSITDKLNQALNQALTHPDVQKTLHNDAITPLPGTPQAVRDQIAHDLDMWRTVIRDANIKLNEG